MHDGMPYGPIQGQGQGHECLKPLERSRPSVPHGTNLKYSRWLPQLRRRNMLVFSLKLGIIPPDLQVGGRSPHIPRLRRLWTYIDTAGTVAD